jgi:formylglycine-generating enzyme required for sulfatase activity
MECLPGGRDAIAEFHREFRTILEDPTCVGHDIAVGLAKNFVRCPPSLSEDGRPYWMGSPDEEPGHADDEFLHLVSVSPFRMGIHPITNNQYELFDASHRSYRRDVPREDDDACCPVVNVSWYDAWVFCKWLGPEYRLPTEAEWEYAARAGTTGAAYGPLEEIGWFACRAGSFTPFHFGHFLSIMEANFWTFGEFSSERGHARTSAVEIHRPNVWGLFDMHGNVCEWCLDLYDPRYYRGSLSANPPGPTDGDHRVIRGGSWLEPRNSARSAKRDSANPVGRASNIGFRLLAEMGLKVGSGPQHNLTSQG